MSFLRSNPVTTDNTPFQNFIECDCSIYLEKMSQRDSYGDHVTLQAAAQLYGVQFLLMSTLGPEGTRFISSASEVCDSLQVCNDKPILLLGHFAETNVLMKEHYVSLSWTNTCDLRDFVRDVVCLQRSLYVLKLLHLLQHQHQNCLHTVVHSVHVSRSWRPIRKPVAGDFVSSGTKEGRGWNTTQA